MEEVNNIYLILGTILITATIGGFAAISYIRSRNLDPEVVQKRFKLQNQYTKELEEELESYVKENKRIRGKINSLKGSVGIPGEINLDSADGVSEGIKTLLPQISPLLPPQARQFLNDPRIVDIALEFYKKDPEKAKSILSSLIKRGGRPKSTTGSNDQQSGGQDDAIPNYGEGGIL